MALRAGRPALFRLGCVLCALAAVTFILMVPGTLSILTRILPHSRYHYYYVEDLRTGPEIATMLVCSAAVALFGAVLAFRNGRRQS